MPDPNTIGESPGIGVASAGVLGFISIDDILDLFDKPGKPRSVTARDFEQRALEMGADSAITPFKSTRVGRILYVVVTGGKVLKAAFGNEPDPGADPVFGPLDFLGLAPEGGPAEIADLIRRLREERLLVSQAGTTEVEPTWIGDP